MSQALSASAVALALAALQTPLARLAPAILRRRRKDAGQLLEAGLIKPAGHEPFATATDDFSDTPLSLTWDSEREAFGYFSETGGWRDVSNEETTPYQIDVSRFLSAMTQKISITGKPAELLQSYLWLLGSARLPGRSKRLPLLFCRRLQDGDLWRKVETLLRNKPSQEPRIVLTSTPADHIPDTQLCFVIPFVDVIDSITQQVDAAALSKRIGQTDAASDEPLKLLADGKTVIFLGKTYLLVKGVRQRELVQVLYRYYLRGEHPVASGKLLEELELGSSTRIRDLFKGSPVWRTLVFEKNGMCGFCFPGVFD
jgi:hypothetical protein